ncbi:MAG: sugar ABC transporter permease [Eubacteriales bacterium]|nr:sugar ABC transporter permease [Eubacteriales bacterium]
MAENLDRRLRRNAAKANAVRRGSSGRNSKRGRFISWIFLAPSLIGVGLFFVLPFGVVIYYSLINNPVQHKFVGIQNFITTWSNNAFRLASLNTLLFSAVAVPLSVVLSLWLAVIMESKIPFKSTFRTFFLSPMMVPIASVILVWQVLFDYNGLINVWMMKFGLEKIDWLKSAYAPVVIIILFLWKNLGYNMILFMAGLSSVPKDQIEVARLESATENQIFWMIKLRYLSSTIMFVIIMSLVNSFKVFREIYLLTGDYPFDPLYMLQHFMNNTFQNLDFQKLSAAAIIMAAFMMVVIGLLLSIEDRFGRDLEM